MADSSFKVAGLFAGIGGLELGLGRAMGREIETSLFCEWWEPAKTVLTHRFPEVELAPDVRELKALPSEVNLVTAGFPCTDLSQAGRMEGIRGEASGLVSHVFRLLRKIKAGARPTLVIENVPNMLVLDRGGAMRYLVDEIEKLGYSWAYRVVDSRFTGVPQRRRRVIMVASRELDPRRVLFADDAGDRGDEDFVENAFGFYWTEGRGGLGWAKDAVPTLKGGSTIGIPSPPAIWVPQADVSQRFIKPSVEDAEQMQGFDRGWTDLDFGQPKSKGPRWKLVGNAVTVGVAEWLGSRLASPGDALVSGSPLDRSRPWPTAAHGYKGHVWDDSALSEFPIHRAYQHLADVINFAEADALSLRGAAGFWSRLQRGNLGKFPGFRDDISGYVQELAAAGRAA